MGTNNKKLGHKIWSYQSTQHVCSICFDKVEVSWIECNQCGASLKGFSSKNEGYREYNEDSDYYICSNCGEDVGLTHDSCPKCEIKFDNVFPPSTEKELLLICPSCKTNQKNLDAEYCIQCGEALFTKKIVEVKQCPDCKTNYEITDKFCDKDGEKLKIIEIEVEKEI